MLRHLIHAQKIGGSNPSSAIIIIRYHKNTTKNIIIMGKRSKVPKWIKRGEGKTPVGKGEQQMTGRTAKGRTKRFDTGKKYNKGKHNTPNIK